MIVALWIAIGAVADEMADLIVPRRDFTGRSHRITAFVIWCILGPLTIPLLLLHLIRGVRK